MILLSRTRERENIEKACPKKGSIYEMPSEYAKKCSKKGPMYLYIYREREIQIYIYIYIYIYISDYIYIYVDEMPGDLVKEVHDELDLVRDLGPTEDATHRPGGGVHHLSQRGSV